MFIWIPSFCCFLSGVLVLDLLDDQPAQVHGELLQVRDPVYEAGPQSLLVGGTQVQVGHVGVKVRLPLGMEGVRIDAGADIVQFHLGCIADVHAVDLDGSEQQQE